MSNDLSNKTWEAPAVVAGNGLLDRRAFLNGGAAFAAALTGYGLVKSAAAEQVKASRNITKVMETMGSKVSMIKRASGEVRTGSELIVKAIERIKMTARENAELASNLNNAVEVLTAQTGALKKELGRFTI